MSEVPKRYKPLASIPSNRVRMPGSKIGETQDTMLSFTEQAKRALKAAGIGPARRRYHSVSNQPQQGTSKARSTVALPAGRGNRSESARSKHRHPRRKVSRNHRAHAVVVLRSGVPIEAHSARNSSRRAKRSSQAAQLLASEQIGAPADYLGANHRSPLEAARQLAREAVARRPAPLFEPAKRASEQEPAREQPSLRASLSRLAAKQVTRKQPSGSVQPDQAVLPSVGQSPIETFGVPRATAGPPATSSPSTGHLWKEGREADRVDGIGTHGPSGAGAISEDDDDAELSVSVSSSEAGSELSPGRPGAQPNSGSTPPRSEGQHEATGLGLPTNPATGSVHQLQQHGASKTRAEQGMDQGLDAGHQPGLANPAESLFERGGANRSSEMMDPLKAEGGSAAGGKDPLKPPELPNRALAASQASSTEPSLRASGTADAAGNEAIWHGQRAPAVHPLAISDKTQADTVSDSPAPASCQVLPAAPPAEPGTGRATTARDKVDEGHGEEEGEGRDVMAEAIRSVSQQAAATEGPACDSHRMAGKSGGVGGKQGGGDDGRGHVAARLLNSRSQRMAATMRDDLRRFAKLLAAGSGARRSQSQANRSGSREAGGASSDGSSSQAAAAAKGRPLVCTEGRGRDGLEGAPVGGTESGSEDDEETMDSSWCRASILEQARKDEAQEESTGRDGSPPQSGKPANPTASSAPGSLSSTRLKQLVRDAMASSSGNTGGGQPVGAAPGYDAQQARLVRVGSLKRMVMGATAAPHSRASSSQTSKPKSQGAWTASGEMPEAAASAWLERGRRAMSEHPARTRLQGARHTSSSDRSVPVRAPALDSISTGASSRVDVAPASGDLAASDPQPADLSLDRSDAMTVRSTRSTSTSCSLVSPGVGSLKRLPKLVRQLGLSPGRRKRSGDGPARRQVPSPPSCTTASDSSRLQAPLDSTRPSRSSTGSLSAARSGVAAAAAVGDAATDASIRAPKTHNSSLAASAHDLPASPQQRRSAVHPSSMLAVGGSQGDTSSRSPMRQTGQSPLSAYLNRVFGDGPVPKGRESSPRGVDDAGNLGQEQSGTSSTSTSGDWGRQEARGAVNDSAPRNPDARSAAHAPAGADAPAAGVNLQGSTAVERAMASMQQELQLRRQRLAMSRTARTAGNQHSPARSSLCTESKHELSRDGVDVDAGNMDSQGSEGDAASTTGGGQVVHETSIFRKAAAEAVRQLRAGTRPREQSSVVQDEWGVRSSWLEESRASAASGGARSRGASAPSPSAPSSIGLPSAPCSRQTSPQRTGGSKEPKCSSGIQQAPGPSAPAQNNQDGPPGQKRPCAWQDASDSSSEDGNNPTAEGNKIRSSSRPRAEDGWRHTYGVPPSRPLLRESTREGEHNLELGDAVAKLLAWEREQEAPRRAATSAKGYRSAMPGGPGAASIGMLGAEQLPVLRVRSRQTSPAGSVTGTSEASIFKRGSAGAQKLASHCDQSAISVERGDEVDDLQAISSLLNDRAVCDAVGADRMWLDGSS